MKYQSIRNTIGSILLSERGWFLIALTLGLSAVLTVGPQLQTFSAALLTSQEASIYSSAYNTSVVLFPALADWLAQTWSPIYLLMASTIVFFSTRRAAARSIFVLGSITTFFVLTVADIIWFIFYDSFKFSVFFESVLANLAGGPIVCCVVLLILNFCDALDLFLDTHPLIGRVLRLCVPLLIGLLVQIGGYYLITLFYNPTNTSVDATVAAPVSGYYSTADLRWTPSAPAASNGTETAQKSEPFGILSRQTEILKSLTWTGDSKALDVSWVRSSDDEYDVTISVFDGCIFGSSATQRQDKRESISFSSISQLSMRIDEGMGELKIGTGDGHAGYFSTPGEETGMYWLDTGEENNTLKVSTFLDKNAQLKYWNPTGDLRLEASAFLVGKRKGEKRGHLINRKIVLQVDGQKRTFEFAPDESAKWSDEMTCRKVAATSAISGGPIASGLVVSVVVLIEPKDHTLAGSMSRRDDNGISIGGLNGWLVADNLPKSEVSRFINGGRLGMMSFSGAVKHFQLNGSAIELNGSENIFIHYAQLLAAVDDEGEIRITGRADAIYKDGERLNKTRWERLDWPARVVIFGGLPGLLLWLFSVLIAILKKNAPINSLKANLAGKGDGGN